MATSLPDEPALGSLLDKAGQAFSIASKLGWAFDRERQEQQGPTDAAHWNLHKPQFDEFCQVLEALQISMENPPDGFADVAAALIQATRLAKRIREVMKTDDGKALAEYRNLLPDLNTLAHSGCLAVKAAQQEISSGKEETLLQESKILRDADPELVSSFPPPAEGRFVVVLEAPALDGHALIEGKQTLLPPRERLALAWEGRDGKALVGPTDGYLLSAHHEDASWLPASWEMSVFPAGWALPHLESWFGYAIRIARIEDRPDLPMGSEGGPADIPSARGLVAHAHMILRHMGLPGSPREPKGPMDRAGCVAELRELLAFVQNSVPPLVCDEHLPAFETTFECLAYLKNVTPKWPDMGIDWPLVLAKTEQWWPGSSPSSNTPPDEPKPGQELPEFLAGFAKDEEVAKADPYSRSFACASLLLEIFQQVQAFSAASLAFGYDLDAIPAGSQRLSPFHALMCMGWPLVSTIQALRDTAEADFKAINFTNEVPIQIGTAFGKNAHDAVYRLAVEICEVVNSVTDAKLSVESLSDGPQGTVEHAWARLCGALEGRLPDSLTVKRVRIQLETESREAFVRANSSQNDDTEPKKRFPTPAGAKWKDVAIRFVDSEHISVVIGKLRMTVSFIEMGMVDGRNGERDCQWELFRVLARDHGTLTWESKSASRLQKKRKQLLAQNLKRFFQIPGEPIVLTPDRKGWMTVFKLMDEWSEKSQGERNLD